MATETLFKQFSTISEDQWLDQIKSDLKGADYNKKLVWKTLDGIVMKPFFTDVDCDERKASKSVRRGPQHDGRKWRIREQVREQNVADARAHILRAQERGAQEASLLTYPSGVPVFEQEDMSQLIEGVNLNNLPIHWLAGPFAPQTAAMFLNELARKRLDSVSIRGSVDYDPLLDAAAAWTVHGFDGWQERAVRFYEAVMVLPQYTWITIRGNQVEKGGASIAQELGISMSLAAGYLTLLSEHGKDPVQCAKHMEFRYAVGSNYLLEIAKLRAHRVLAENLLKAFGVTDVFPAVHVDTTSSNKTLYDPFNNLLRATIESMAAAMGGADSISPAAFDQGYHSPDEFSEHLARNTHHLLRDEAFLDKVSDPLGGSYVTEYLTDQYVEKAWDLFYAIQKHGGFAEAWKCGFLPGEIAKVRHEKALRVSTGKTPIVGTTVYPQVSEKRLDSVGKFRLSRRLDNTSHNLDELRQNFLDGASLNDYESGEPVGDSALNSFRPAWPIEHLRLRMERFVKHGGKAPTVLLAQFGERAMRKARADFCAGFFGIGGYDVLKSEVFASAEALAARVSSNRPDVLVLCSSNEEYADFAKALNEALDDCRPLVIVGGYQGLDIKELRASGIDDFVYARADAVAFLHALHEKFEIPQETL
jgi:methylmalonyl-CoA mutase